MLVHDRYRIERTLGEGGTGRVSLAIDTHTDRHVALKELFLEFRHHMSKLEKEFRIQSRVGANHPNIPTTYDYMAGDRDKGIMPCFSMECVRGATLIAHLCRLGEPRGDEARRQIKKRLSLVQTVAPGLLRALGHIHANGLVHHDVKPQNIMLSDEWGRRVPYLVDYGTARRPWVSWRHFVGTEEYAAPELLAGGRFDRKADLYAVGLVLYEIIAGRRPWKGRQNLCRRRKEGLFPALPKWCPAGLADLIQHLLAPKPKHRPQSAEAVFDRLTEVLDLTEEWNPDPVDKSPTRTVVSDDTAC